MSRRLFYLLGTGLLLGLGLSGFVITGYSHQPQTLSNQIAVLGGIAPDFQVDSLTGSPVNLSQFRGKPVLINFWTTWCEPCKVELPLIGQYYEKYRDNLVILAIDTEEMPSDVTNFVKDMKLDFIIATDPDGTVADLYRVDGFPTSFFIDANGKIQAEAVGSLSDTTIGQYLFTLGIKP